MQTKLRRAPAAGRSLAFLVLLCLAVVLHSGSDVRAESEIQIAQAAPDRAEQSGPQNAPGQPVETLAFRWPIPSRAKVTVDTVKRGRSLKQRFTLVAERQAGSQDILVSFRDFEFLEIDGQPINTPERKKAVETATGLAAAIPSLRIDATGRPLGVAGLDALFETLKKTLLKGLPAEEVEKFTAFLDDPATRKQAAAAALDNWNAWVGAWLGMPVLPAEGKVDLVTTVFGQSVTQPTVFRNLGKADACPTCIRVQAQGIMSGPEFMRAWSGMMRSMVEQGGGQAEGFDDFMKSVEDVRREASYGAVIDTTTMQPVTAEKQINMVMNIKGQEPKSQSEGTTFQFDWQAKPRR